jgi:hypothetical protein
MDMDNQLIFEVCTASDQYLLNTRDPSTFQNAFRTTLNEMTKPGEPMEGQRYAVTKMLVEACLDRAASHPQLRRRLRSLLARELVAALPPEASGLPMAF